MPYNEKGIFVADPVLTSLGQSLETQQQIYDIINGISTGEISLAQNSVGQAMGLDNLDLSGLSFNLDFGFRNKYSDEVDNKYPIPNASFALGNTGVDCITLDQYIKDLSEEVSQLKIQNINNTTVLHQGIPEVELKLSAYENKLSKLQDLWIKQDCRNVIETKRQEDISKIFAATSVKQETQVLGKSNAKQYILIGSAAFVLLISIYIITKK